MKISTEEIPFKHVFGKEEPVLELRRFIMSVEYRCRYTPEPVLLAVYKTARAYLLAYRVVSRVSPVVFAVMEPSFKPEHIADQPGHCHKGGIMVEIQPFFQEVHKKAGTRQRLGQLGDTVLSKFNELEYKKGTRTKVVSDETTENGCPFDPD